MKTILFACLLVCVYCDSVPVSSYSSLPYETDPGYYANSVHDYQPQQLGYPDRGKSKFAFHFGKIVKTPYNIVKGASSYVNNVFSDIKGKLMQLKGSIARTKGNSLVAYGEDLLRKSHLFRGKHRHHPQPVHHYVQSYYTHNTPSYYTHNTQYAEPKPSYYEPSAQFYGGIAGGFSAGNSREFGHPKPSDIVHHTGFKPSPFIPHGKDLTALESQAVQSVETIDNRIPEGRSGKAVGRSVAIVDSEPRIAAGLSGLEYDRPIPVPVPIAIAPSRLVFPQLPYH